MLTLQLKHTRPPVSDTQQPGLSLDDLLGPAEVVGDAPEAERQQHLPPWQVQKIALSRKFPDGWSPMTRLSREAQDGLRLLHAADPERFSVDVLSRRFRISVESVRRILKSRWQPSAKAVERQNRRAKLMEASRHSTSAATAVREQLELAALRSGSSSGTVPIEQAPRSAGSSPARDPSYEHPVRFEGLVTSSDLAAGRQRQKSVASRGSGDWCLVDAGWCVVHVMTRDARERFRIEDLWRDNGTDTFRAAPPSGARS